MLSGLPMIVLMAAQAAATPPASEPPPAIPVEEAAGYGPALPPPPKPKVKAPSEPCKTPEPKDVTEDTREIVVCAQRPEGYRIDPDILEAQRAKKNRTKPKRPERLVDNSCATVGPMGCRGGATIDIVNAAVVLATMAQKAVSGENVGKMFITDPQASEYELYLEAKRQREAKEAEQAAAAKAKAAADAAEAAKGPVETR
jgi:hypothetical protein